jgi:hypothetical protein
VCTARQTWLVVFCSFAIGIATEHPALADIKDIAHFQTLMPHTSSLVRGQRVKISARVEIVSYPEESIESTALLTVNGQSFKPFYTILTPGEIKGTEEFTWFVVATGNSLTVRFRLILIGNKSKEGYEVVDVTRDYQVKSPRHRPKRFCKK